MSSRYVSLSLLAKVPDLTLTPLRPLKLSVAFGDYDYLEPIKSLSNFLSLSLMLVSVYKRHSNFSAVVVIN